MNTCKDCVHWGAEWKEAYSDSRHCSAICGNGENGAQVAGYDEEGIETKANFGCIHFSPKPSGETKQ